MELDDRIPFISKLKKYTSVYANREQFKYYEVDIGNFPPNPKTQFLNSRNLAMGFTEADFL